MANFNFLSGSSIDIFPSFLFDIMENEDCFLGFAKGTPVNQWGISALVQIEHPTDDYLSSIAISGIPTENKFYDDNALSLSHASVDKKRVYIARYNTIADPSLTSPFIMNDGDVGTLNLSYINNTWAVVQGLASNYYDLMPYTSDDLSETYVYYLMNWDQNSNIKLKIRNKTYITPPNYITRCELFMSPVSGSPYEKICTNLEKSTNILGETYTTGLLDPATIGEGQMESILNVGVSATEKKAIIKSATFKLVNMIGEVIIDNMTFVDPELTSSNLYTEVSSYESSQKYLTLKYLYVDGKYQYMKFIIGANIINALGIWQEALPFESIIPVADANPPGLDISYLKNCAMQSSLFDINGFTKIKSSEVKFVKEITNTTEINNYTNAGFNIETLTLIGENIYHSGIIRETILATVPTNVIPLYEYHSFVVGDTIYIPFKPQTQTNPGGLYVVEYVFADSIQLTTTISIDEDLLKDVELQSNATNVNASVTLATTTNKDKALNYGFYNVLVTKNVPKMGVLSPTENIYRQLFIAYKPKTSSGTFCTNDVYNGDTSPFGVNFNPNLWKYDNGLIIYLSNKLPVYRKWATDDEQFKIIL